MATSTESKLASLAAGQWGMFTAAQATAAGVARSTLVRRVQTKTLEHVRTGVYRLPGAPSSPADEIRAAWLASSPAAPAWDRLTDPDAVVGGAAAASIHGMGDLYPAPYLIYTTTRRRTRHDDVRYSARPLPVEDVMILDGLPVTTRERTLADLLNDGGDISLVADALRDAEESAGDLDVQSLIEHLTPMAKGLGYSSGIALYEDLRSLSAVDEARLRDLIENTDLADQLNAAVEARLREALAPIAERMDRQMREAIEPFLRTAAHITMPKMPQLNVPIAPIKMPKVSLPPNMMAKFALPPETEAMLQRLGKMSAKMPRPTSTTDESPSTPTTPPEEPDDQ